jgi:hypothetical protein
MIEATTVAVVEATETAVEVVVANPGLISRAFTGGANLVSKHPVGAALVGTAVVAGSLYGTWKLWNRMKAKDMPAVVAQAMQEATGAQAAA